MLERLTLSLQKYWYAFIAILPRLALAILVVVVGVIIARWLSRIFRERLVSNSHDPLMGRFLGKAIRFILIVIVALIGLNAAGLSNIAGGILATAGASAVVIGFAFKDIAENFIAGIILAFNRPFNLEETIQIDDTFGKVKDMAFRYTKIATFDGREIYIPNSDVLKKPVVNFTGNGYFRMEFIVGIAYEDSIDQAKDIIREVIRTTEGVVNDDKHKNFVVEDNLSASTVDLKVMFWITTDDYRIGALVTRGRVMKNVKNAMDEAGIYLPCEIQELKTYGPAEKIIVEMTGGAGGPKAEEPKDTEKSKTGPTGIAEDHSGPVALIEREADKKTPPGNAV